MKKTCRDCGVPMLPIQILDRGHMNYRVPGLAYADVDAQRKWFGEHPEAGDIVAVMCPQCHEVRLFARPKVEG